MSKLKCLCGHVIVDQTDNLFYKGYILPDMELDSISDTLTNSIDSLLEAIKLNKRLDWINKHFRKEYPIDLKESSMVHDLVTKKLIVSIRHIFECEKCGRIAIEVGNSHKYEFYNSDNGTAKGILKKSK